MCRTLCIKTLNGRPNNHYVLFYFFSYCLLWCMLVWLMQLHRVNDLFSCDILWLSNSAMENVNNLVLIWISVLWFEDWTWTLNLCGSLCSLTIDVEYDIHFLYQVNGIVTVTISSAIQIVIEQCVLVNWYFVNTEKKDHIAGWNALVYTVLHD